MKYNYVKLKGTRGKYRWFAYYSKLINTCNGMGFAKMR